MDLLKGLRSTMEGERERAPALLWTCSSEEEEADLDRKEEKKYIYTLSPQRSLKLRQCRVSSTAVPHHATQHG